MYKDITTYSQKDKERKPSILENETNGIRFTVHKHIYYGDEWLLTCRKLGVEHLRLNTNDMEEAKINGIVMESDLRCISIFTMVMNGS